MSKKLYFAYGSNLNHYQMKNLRCAGSKYLKSVVLKNYSLSFCHPNSKNAYGYANVTKKKGSNVPGAIWEITKDHEKILDNYEDFPKSYRKEYFYVNGKKVMFYIMGTCSYKKPSKRYLNIIIEGYKNCNLDLNYLKRIMSELQSKL